MPNSTPNRTGAEPIDMRRTIGLFATGVAVVTTLDGSGGAQGMTVNSLTSVCLDPPTLLVSLTSDARTTLSVQTSGRYAVSILGRRQESIARRFATRGSDHFADLPSAALLDGMPVIPDALAHLACTTIQAVAAEDHTIFIGRVDATASRLGDPLTYLAGQFGGFRAQDHARLDWFF